MDFSLTTFFVATTGTLQASGGTEVTPAGTIGLFRPDYTLATAGNIAAAKYFYINTGRPIYLPGTGSIRSDKIAAANVIDWYKTVSEDTASLQISNLSGWNVKCGQDVIVNISVHSKFTDLAFYNGLNESVIVTAPCCDCGEVPCAQIDDTDKQALVDQIVAKLRANPRLSAVLTFERLGSAGSSILNVAAKPVQQITNATDIAAQQPYFDRPWFRIFAFTGAEAMVDYQDVFDVCDGATAVATVTQRSTFQHGSSGEIRNLERFYRSYQEPAFKSLYRNPGWNGAYQTQVVDGTFYDLFYLKFRQYDHQRTWASYVEMDSSVIVAFPAGTGGAFETVLTAALGAPKNQSGVDVSTTTTTSTSSTTTTTTSTLSP